MVYKMAVITNFDFLLHEHHLQCMHKLLPRNELMATISTPWGLIFVVSDSPRKQRNLILENSYPYGSNSDN